MTPLALEAIGIRKRFGAVEALAGVSLKVRQGSVHALLGENGAGKSTLVKCLTGYYTQDDGQFLVAGRELVSRSPRDALRAGIGMVYQHFTLVPSMTVAENLMLARADIPFAIDWRDFGRELERLLATMPFRVKLDARADALAAGEKQKVEILKQLLMRRRLLVLDEPSSVLTPQEADDVLGALHSEAAGGGLSVVLITHKFREVRQFADDVTVLRGGRVAGGGPAAGLSDHQLAELMVGAAQAPAVEGAVEGAARSRPGVRASGPERLGPQRLGPERLGIQGLRVRGSGGALAVDGLSLSVRAGEILGIAGVSGNGQRELVQALAGQRAAEAGSVRVDGAAFSPTRRALAAHRVALLPEEPLRNACVAGMSVAENLALRSYDQPPMVGRRWPARWWLAPSRMAGAARGAIARHHIRAGGPGAAADTLSGGNVQRLVLARELGEQEVGLLIAANPCFGLDFAAAARIHDRIREARDAGAGVLLISEDLDELFEMADRIAVLSGGRIIHQTARDVASRSVIGQAMAGHVADHRENHAA
jgi:simple sugar transport system ATP-binding protein